MNKKRIVVICPGRGSYTRETNKYLKQHNGLAKKQIKWMDEQRESKRQISLTKLDSQNFRAKTHMIGENASTLIYACSFSDFLSLDKTKYEIVSILSLIHI